MALVKCPNRLCGKELSDEFKKCPFCGTPLSLSKEEYENYKKEVFVKSLSDDYNGLKKKIQVTSKLPYPLEIVGFFANIYGAIASEGKIRLRKILLISFIEALIGIVFSLLGYFISLGVGSGNNDASAFFYMVGITICCHAFYSLVKFGSFYLLGKVNYSLSELQCRWIVFAIEMIIGVIFIELFVANEDETSFYFFIIGLGLVIGGIWSIIKYYRNRKKNEFHSGTISDNSMNKKDDVFTSTSSGEGVRYEWKK